MRNSTLIEKIDVYMKTQERDGKTKTVKCSDRQNDKIRFYVTEKDLIDDGKATASHELEGMPLYRIEVTAVKERLIAAWREMVKLPFEEIKRQGMLRELSLYDRL